MKAMRSRVLPRIWALWLTLGLALPSTAFALRPIESVESGLEEDISDALRGPDDTDLESPEEPVLSRRLVVPGGQAGTLELEVAFSSWIGERDRQEDSADILSILDSADNPVGFSAAIADGVSSVIRADVSGRTAVGSILRGYADQSSLLQQYLSAEKEEQENIELKLLGRARTVFEGLHRSMGEENARYRRALGDQSIYETTATSVLLAGGTALISHVGDTRVYRLRQGKLTLLTPDDNGAWLRAAEKLGKGASLDDLARAAREYSRSERNAGDINPRGLTSALGKLVGMEKPPGYLPVMLRIYQSVVHLEPGDILLLTVDGVHEEVDPDHIAECFRDPSQPVDQGVRRLLRMSGTGSDNRTMIAIRWSALAGLEENPIDAVLAEQEMTAQERGFVSRWPTVQRRVQRIRESTSEEFTADDLEQLRGDVREALEEYRDPSRERVRLPEGDILVWGPPTAQELELLHEMFEQLRIVDPAAYQMVLRNVAVIVFGTTAGSERGGVLASFPGLVGMERPESSVTRSEQVDRWQRTIVHEADHLDLLSRLPEEGVLKDPEFRFPDWEASPLMGGILHPQRYLLEASAYLAEAASLQSVHGRLIDESKRKSLISLNNRQILSDVEWMLTLLQSAANRGKLNETGMVELGSIQRRFAFVNRGELPRTLRAAAGLEEAEEDRQIIEGSKQMIRSLKFNNAVWNSPTTPPDPKEFAPLVASMVSVVSDEDGRIIDFEVLASQEVKDRCASGKLFLFIIKVKEDPDPKHGGRSYVFVPPDPLLGRVELPERAERNLRSAVQEIDNEARDSSSPGGPAAGLEEDSEAAQIRRSILEQEGRRVVPGAPMPGYVRLASDELVRGQLDRLPQDVLDYFNISYSRFVFGNRDVIRAGGFEFRTARLIHDPTGHQFQVSVIGVQDIPQDLLGVYQQLTLQTMLVPAGSQVENQEWMELNHRHAVLHEVGEIIWQWMSESAKDHWRRIHRKEGPIYARNMQDLASLRARTKTPDEVTTADIHSLMAQPRDAAGEIFADTVAHWKDPDGFFGRKDQPPPLREEEVFMLSMLVRIRAEARTAVRYPGTYVVSKTPRSVPIFEVAELFRVEQRLHFSVESTGFLLEGQGLAFAPILALLETRGTFPDPRFAGVVQSRGEKDRLLDAYTGLPQVRELLDRRLVVVEEQEGATLEERQSQARWAARIWLQGLAVQEVTRLEERWVLQLNNLLGKVGYRVPADFVVFEAARYLLYAA